MLVLLALLFAVPDASSSQLAGNWVTKDNSVVQVLPCSESAPTLCARLVYLGRADAPKTDIGNPDPALKTRALCGLTIGTGFTPDGADKAAGGRIYDPESGKTYSGQMQLDGSALKLRGYVGTPMFGRTETWHKEGGMTPPCR